jgi:hypothetical protein
LGRGEAEASAASGHQVHPVAQSKIHAVIVPWRPADPRARDISILSG